MQNAQASKVSIDGYDDIQVELTDVVFSRMFPAVLLGTFGVLVATALLAQHFSDPILWVLMGLAVLVSGARIVVALAYGRRPKTPALTIIEAKRWEFLYAAATILYASIVAVVTVMVFLKHDTGGMFLCAASCLTVSAESSSRLGLQPRMMKISGMIPLAALALCALTTRQPLVMAGGVMVALYSYTFMQSAQRNCNAIVDQLRAQRTLKDSAERDALTLLPNRLKLRGRLTELCKTDTPFAVLFLDLDDFKIVNDTLGHGAGDELLLQVAGRLKAMMRETDLLARIGGDEFAILQIPASSKREVVALAERINQQIAAPYRVLGEKAVVGVSVGVRLAIGGINKPDELLHRADTALYNVKAAGKGGFSVVVD